MKLPKIYRHGKKYRAKLTKQGTQHLVSASTYEECQIKLEQLYKRLSCAEKQSEFPTLLELLHDYHTQVLSKRSTARDCQFFINSFEKSFPQLAHKPINLLTRQDVLYWRNQRLKEVSPLYLKSLKGMFSGALTWANKECLYDIENPFLQVRFPAEYLPRDRRVTEDELHKLRLVADYQLDKHPTNLTQVVVWVFHFAICTCMRLGEICQLTTKDIHSNHIHLAKTKNGTSRNVPLSAQAKQLLSVIKMPRQSSVPVLGAQIAKTMA